MYACIITNFREKPVYKKKKKFQSLPATCTIVHVLMWTFWQFLDIFIWNTCGHMHLALDGGSTVIFLKGDHTGTISSTFGQKFGLIESNTSSFRGEYFYLTFDKNRSNLFNLQHYNFHF